MDKSYCPWQQIDRTVSLTASRLNKKIADGGLSSLKKHKRLIINLDDLETFWALSIPSDAAQEFIGLTEDWNRESQKGKFHYNISSFMTTQKNGLIKNDEYKKFFYSKSSQDSAMT